MLNELLDDMQAGIPIGRQPHISIDNRQFNAVFGGEKRSIAEWDNERGAAFMEFIVIGSGKSVFKIMYAQKAYDPANPSPPICWSANGQGPSNQVRQPQAALCASCQWDVWGSAVNDNGDKVKRCTDKKRLVVISTKLGVGTPLQFDIPPAAFKSWMGLMKVMKDGRIQAVENVVIRVYFVSNEEGVLSFNLSGYVDQRWGPDVLAQVRHTAGTPEVWELSGRSEIPINPASWNPTQAIQQQAAVTPPPVQNMIASQPSGMGQPQVQYQPQQQFQSEMTGRDYVQAAEQQRDPVYTSQPAHQMGGATGSTVYGGATGSTVYGGGGSAPAHTHQMGGGGGSASAYQGGMGGGGGSAPAHTHQMGGGMGGGGSAPAYQGGMGGGMTTPQQPPQAALPAPEVVEQTKRKRRTKAEMEADRLAAEAAKTAAPAPASGPIHDRQAQYNTNAGMGGGVSQGSVMANHGMNQGSAAPNSLRNQLNSALDIEIPK